MRTTLIIASYNRPAHLERTLHSVARQTMLPDQIVIADDGSDADIAAVVNAYRKGPLRATPIDIVSQEHRGFRKCAILNKALRAATGEYIIHTDGDMYLERRFIADHVSLAAPHCIIGGGRAKLQASYGDISRFDGVTFGNLRHIARPLRLIRGLHLPCHTRHRYAIGNNTSYYKSDVEAVNGYNEDIVNTGGEDVDISLRMLNNGCRLRRVSGRCLGIHLWHSVAYRTRPFNITARLLRTLPASGTTWISNGLRKDDG